MPITGVDALGRVAAPAIVAPTDLAQTFAVGQSLRGTVVRLLPYNSALVNFHDQPLLLEPVEQLVPGQTVVATVTQVAPVLLLRLADAPTASVRAQAALALAQAVPEPEQGIFTAAQLKAYFAASQPFGEIAARLTDLLAGAPILDDLVPAATRALWETLAVLQPQDESPPDATRLRQQVERSGLNYESKVQRVLTTEPQTPGELEQDLKGQMLDLAQRLEQVANTPADARQGEAARLLESVKQAVDALEFLQLANQFAREERHPLLLPLVSPFTSPTHTAQLTIHRDGGNGGHATTEPERYTVAFALKLTALGPLHIAATVSGDAVSTTFQVEDPAVAAYLSLATPELVAQLQALGLHASVTYAARRQVGLDATTPLPQALTRASHLVDVKI